MNTPQFMAAVAFCATHVAFSQDLSEPVYQLPGETGGLFSYFQMEQGIEYGDSAQLAGTNRFVTDASVWVYSDIERTGVVTFSLYDAVPADFNFPPDFEVGQPGVTPGALADFKPAVDPIYTSGPKAVFFESDAPSGLNLTELVFSDINTLVADDLFWSIKFELISDYTDGGPFGPKLENAADLGPSGAMTDPSRLYQRDGDRGTGDWIPIWLGQSAPPTSTLSAQINAIPEPGVVVLSFLGSLALLRRRRTA
ncbi:hypothetical protein [Haloferula sp.]|uniref:hypothetical protein n=1 Tax=Haloferula sp. TaxID=2497595 RepID=UPI0032A111A8